jgi:hypothetical protein
MEISATYQGQEVSIVDIDTNGSTIYVSYIDSNKNLNITKSFLNNAPTNLASNAKTIGGSGVGGGSVFITDITSISGNVGSKVYDDS